MTAFEDKYAIGNALILFLHFLFSCSFNTEDRHVMSVEALVRKITGAVGCSINVFLLEVHSQEGWQFYAFIYYV